MREKAFVSIRKILKRFIRDLQKFTGETLSEDRLRQIALNITRVLKLFYDIRELKKQNPRPFPNLFIFFMYGCMSYVGNKRDHGFLRIDDRPDKGEDRGELAEEADEKV